MVYGDDPVGSMTLTWVVLAQGRIMRKYLVAVGGMTLLNDKSLYDMMDMEEYLQAEESSVLPARIEGSRAVCNRSTVKANIREPATDCLESVLIGLAREVSSPDRYVQGGGEGREDEVRET